MKFSAISKNYIFSILPATLLLLLCSGCQPAKMAIPSALEPVQEMPVVGRIGVGFDHPFHFGQYAVKDVHYGWNVTSGWGIIIFSQRDSKQQIEFTLSAGNQNRLGRCVTNIHSNDLSFENFLNSDGTLDWNLTFNGGFACTFDATQNDNRHGQWKLAMTQDTDAMVMRGILTDGSTRIDVRGTRNLDGSPIPLTEASGYFFTLHDQAIGSVDLINAGAVRIDSSQEPEIKHALAGAAAALLLYQSIE